MPSQQPILFDKDVHLSRRWPGELVRRFAFRKIQNLELLRKTTTCTRDARFATNEKR